MDSASPFYCEADGAQHLSIQAIGVITIKKPNIT